MTPALRRLGPLALAVALLAAAARPAAADGAVKVDEGVFAYAGCSLPEEIIWAIEDPVFGDLSIGCNASDSYTIVAAACIGDRDCLLRASTDVFKDPCPDARKKLSFSFRCKLPNDPLGPVDPTEPPVQPPVVPSPSPSPPPRSPSPSPSPPPTPSPSPSPPPSGPRDPDSTASMLWGEGGELYRPGGRLGDWSQVGYAAAERDIPVYPAKFDVKTFGARGDGSSDDTDAIQRAIDAASKEASASGQGVAVFMPAGTYRITKKIAMRASRVVLRGSGKESCTISVPYTLQQVYGGGHYAFGGGFLDLTGRKADSNTVQNKISDVTGDANRGEYRVRVADSSRVAVGDWVRLWQPAASNQARRRLQAAPRLGRRLRQGAPDLPVGKVTVLASDEDPSPSGGRPFVPQWYEDPALQAGLEAAVAAEWDIADALEAEPDRVPAQALQPNATNPLGIDPMFLAAAYYGAMAMDSDDAGAAGTDPANPEVPATAALGTLESYLYGNNLVDSGTPSNMFPGKDRVRFVSRVTAVGPGWVQFERPLPYDVRMKWRPVLHRFAPQLVESGFESFSVVFPWSPYPDHIPTVKGNNAIVMYDVAHCWVKDVRIVDGDNGVNVAGVDFLTITGVDTAFSRPRATGSMAGRKPPANGHHALWGSYCSNVLFTKFRIDGTWFHDLSVDSFAESTVYSDGWGSNLNIDCHRAAVHNNLFTNLDTGAGTRTFVSGGEASRGANSGANNTWWNVRSSSGSNAGLPPCSFGPLLNFFGYWNAPGTGKTRRLLGAEAARGRLSLTSMAAGKVTAMGGGSGAAAAAAAGGEEEDGRQRAWAMAPGWCTREGWWVEQAGAGKSVWPPDLHAAMVAARKAGRMK